MAECGYCNPVNETVLWADGRCRVILADEPGFAGWCRVVWAAHVRELSDLAAGDRNHLIEVVATLEAILIELLGPEKMNIAALGTAAPHLHFHVIPRFGDDPTFPDPAWVPRKRQSQRTVPADFESALRARLQSRLQASA